MENEKNNPEDYQKKKLFIETALETFRTHMQPFKSYLESVDPNNNRDSSEVREMINYLGNMLHTCFDEPYFYDTELDGDKSEYQKLSPLEKVNLHIKPRLEELDGKVNASILCHTRVRIALELYFISDKKPADLRAFEKAYKEAIDIYAISFRKYGDSTICDHLKSVGMALLGVIVTLLTSPAFLLPKHDHSQWIKHQHFFAGSETTKSKEVQRSLREAVGKLGLEDKNNQDTQQQP